MSSDPAEAGRKGGRSRSLKKLLACRRNGFQKKETRLEPVRVEPTSNRQPQLPINDSEKES